jgi:hypothetical protein
MTGFSAAVTTWTKSELCFEELNETVEVVNDFQIEGGYVAVSAPRVSCDVGCWSSSVVSIWIKKRNRRATQKVRSTSKARMQAETFVQSPMLVLLFISYCFFLRFSPGTAWAI